MHNGMLRKVERHLTATQNKMVYETGLKQTSVTFLM